MLCLTMTQPYSTLVALGEKSIETRHWKAPQWAIGQRLAIHAAKGWPRDDQDWQFGDPDWVALLTRLGLTDVSKFPRGAVVATATLTDCVRMTKGVYDDPPWIAGCQLSEQEQMLGFYAPGRYAWFLDDVVALPEPILARGSLGLWEFDESLLAVAS